MNHNIFQSSFKVYFRLQPEFFNEEEGYLAFEGIKLEIIGKKKSSKSRDFVLQTLDRLNNWQKKKLNFLLLGFIYQPFGNIYSLTVPKSFQYKTEISYFRFDIKL